MSGPEKLPVRGGSGIMSSKQSSHGPSIPSVHDNKINSLNHGNTIVEFESSGASPVEKEQDKSQNQGFGSFAKEKTENQLKAPQKFI